MFVQLVTLWVAVVNWSLMFLAVQGSHTGNAEGFRISGLLRLAETRTSKSTITLLHHILQVKHLSSLCVHVSAHLSPSPEFHVIISGLAWLDRR